MHQLDFVLPKRDLTKLLLCFWSQKLLMEPQTRSYGNR